MNTNGKITVLLPSVTLSNLFKTHLHWQGFCETTGCSDNRQTTFFCLGPSWATVVSFNELVPKN